jgi:hypothetical protein
MRVQGQSLYLVIQVSTMGAKVSHHPNTRAGSESRYRSRNMGQPTGNMVPTEADMGSSMPGIQSRVGKSG